MIQICFISNHQHGKLISILYPKYLPMKLHYLVEGRVIGDSKHEEESLAASHVLFAHCAKFLLAGSVQYCNTNIVSIGLDLDETNERKQTRMNIELTGFVQLEIDTSKNKNRSYTKYRLI